MTDEERIAALEQQVATLQATVANLAPLTGSFGGAPQGDPLISAVTWQRQDPPGLSGYMPNELLSLISDNQELNSFAWPLFIDLQTTTHPAATLDTSQNTGVNVRQYQAGGGSPWAAAYHAEVHHGQARKDSSDSTAKGVSLGLNIEFSRRCADGLVYGIELNQAVSTHDIDAGINIAAGSARGSSYKAGIQLQGKMGVGIDLGPNDLRLAQGGRVWLAANAWMQYNPASGRIEFHRAGKLVGSW